MTDLDRLTPRQKKMRADLTNPDLIPRDLLPMIQRLLSRVDLGERVDFDLICNAIGIQLNELPEDFMADSLMKKEEVRLAYLAGFQCATKILNVFPPSGEDWLDRKIREVAVVSLFSLLHGYKHGQTRAMGGVSK